MELFTQEEIKSLMNLVENQILKFDVMLCNPKNIIHKEMVEWERRILYSVFQKLRKLK